jgi:hypothetical protein
LSAKQKKLIQALLASKSVADAAEQIGMCERTVRRWMQQAEFRAAYEAAATELFNRIVGRITQVASRAVDVLDTTMLDARTSAGTRVRAALGLLRLCTDLRIGDVLARMDELERSIADMRNEGVRP